MAISVAVFVGKSKDLIPEIAERTKTLTIGNGVDSKTDITPSCYPELRTRIIDLLNTVEAEGGKFHLDGRKYVHPEFKTGNF